MDKEVKIREIIERIKPYINADGGNLEFVDYKDNVVTISLTGACLGCAMIDTTLNDGIKQWIIDEVPEVKDVVLLQTSPEFADYEF